MGGRQSTYGETLLRLAHSGGCATGPLDGRGGSGS